MVWFFEMETMRVALNKPHENIGRVVKAIEELGQLDTRLSSTSAATTERAPRAAFRGSSTK
jgi:hypothetical protein